MKRKMYELIAPENQDLIFWMDYDERILRHISTLNANVLTTTSWSPEKGFYRTNKSNIMKLIFPTILINSNDLIKFVVEMSAELSSSLSSDYPANIFVAYRKDKNMLHVAVGAHDAISERPIHWID